MKSKLRPDNPESLIRRLADMRHVVNLDSVLHYVVGYYLMIFETDNCVLMGANFLLCFAER